MNTDNVRMLEELSHVLDDIEDEEVRRSVNDELHIELMKVLRYATAARDASRKAKAMLEAKRDTEKQVQVGMEAFFDMNITRPGLTPSAILYDAYKKYCTNHEYPVAPTNSFSPFLVTRGVTRMRKSSGIYYNVSLVPDLPKPFVRALPLFRSLFPELFEEPLTRPWVKQKVDAVLSKLYEPVDPSSILANIANGGACGGSSPCEGLLFLDELARVVGIDAMCKERGEAVSTYALHAAVGFDQLWFIGSPPTTREELLRYPIVVLYRKKALPDDCPLPEHAVTGDAWRELQ